MGPVTGGPCCGSMVNGPGGTSPCYGQHRAGNANILGIVRTGGVSDPWYSELIFVLCSDKGQELWDNILSEVKQYMVDMSTVDGVVLFKG